MDFVRLVPLWAVLIFGGLTPVFAGPVEADITQDPDFIYITQVLGSGGDSLEIWNLTEVLPRIRSLREQMADLISRKEAILSGIHRGETYISGSEVGVSAGLSFLAAVSASLGLGTSDSVLNRGLHLNLSGRAIRFSESDSQGGVGAYVSPASFRFWQILPPDSLVVLLESSQESSIRGTVAGFGLVRSFQEDANVGSLISIEPAVGLFFLGSSGMNAGFRIPLVPRIIPTAAGIALKKLELLEGAIMYELQEFQIGRAIKLVELYESTLAKLTIRLKDSWIQQPPTAKPLPDHHPFATVKNLFALDTLSNGPPATFRNLLYGCPGALSRMWREVKHQAFKKN